VIITQNHWGALPKNGISLEGITIFLEKILAKTPKSQTFAKYPWEVLGPSL
jgi:hypothetical protein